MSSASTSRRSITGRGRTDRRDARPRPLYGGRMSRDIFRARERAEEEAYFHQRDAVLIEKLRDRAKLDEIVRALAEKLQIEEPAMFAKIKELGVTRDIGSAFVLAPLVEVAWADGHV